MTIKETNREFELVRESEREREGRRERERVRYETIGEIVKSIACLFDCFFIR
jgi:hypothetical protein